MPGNEQGLSIRWHQICKVLFTYPPHPLRVSPSFLTDVNFWNRKKASPFPWQMHGWIFPWNYRPQFDHYHFLKETQISLPEEKSPYRPHGTPWFFKGSYTPDLVTDHSPTFSGPINTGIPAVQGLLPGTYPPATPKENNNNLPSRTRRTRLDSFALCLGGPHPDSTGHAITLIH